ncbi:hypothetical protein GCM10022206_23600 [Streptomyces chiangmaiensis]
MWADETCPYLEIFTGDTLPYADRRRTGLGVEPMTCAPNAFNSGEGLITLGPGQTHEAQWGINPEARRFRQVALWRETAPGIRHHHGFAVRLAETRQP